ncbi:MAG: hypothetical protein K2K25_08210, partial [Muribaculaceae bacterium]|nr:hypothetical protein [Muribaculaceae bacterium]
IVIYPILNRYASFLPMLTLSETLLLFFILFVVFKRKIRPQMVFIPFISYLMFLVFYYLGQNTSGEDTKDNIGTILRVIYLYTSLTIVGKGFIDTDKAIKWLNIAAILMVCYCLFQTLAAKAGIFLTTYIPGLPIMAEDRDEFILLQQQKYGVTYRAYGLLNEPAALSIYLLLPLVIDLFSDRHIKSKLKKAAFISIGCFVCMSSTGIIMCSAAWIIFIFFNKSKEAQRYKTTAIILLITIIIVIPYTTIWETFMERTFGGSLSSAALENTTRFNALDVLSILFSSDKDLMIGVGMSATDFYIPGFFRVLYCLGIIGLSIIIIQFICIYRNGNQLQKKITLFYIGLNIGTEILLGNFALYYLPFIIANKKEFS